MKILNGTQNLWLCGLAQAGANQLETLKETIEPVWRLFDGLIWTCHHSENISDGNGAAQGETFHFLNQRKGIGSIIGLPWCGRFDFSRNAYLYLGPAQPGDYIVTTDVMEKLNPEWVEKKLPRLITFINENFVDAVYLHSKIFIYRFDEKKFYKGGVHEQLMNCVRGVELTKIPSFEDSSLYFTNLRPTKRDKFHWVNHFCSYFLLPDAVNQAMHDLGQLPEAERNQFFMKREFNRCAFREILRDRKIPLTCAGLLDTLREKGGKLDPELLEFFNSEKILNDFYRLEFCGPHEKEWDGHDFKDMVVINKDGTWKHKSQV